MSVALALLGLPAVSNADLIGYYTFEQGSGTTTVREHIKLDASKASVADSKEIVRICTVYAQKGMWNIFLTKF